MMTMKKMTMTTMITIMTIEIVYILICVMLSALPNLFLMRWANSLGFDTIVL
jgi:hypothetical protein